MKYLDSIWNGFKELNQFSEAVRRYTTLTTKVAMERWNELAEGHSVVWTMAKQIHNVARKMLCSRPLLRCLIYF